jgi:hypothetical protein
MLKKFEIEGTKSDIMERPQKRFYSAAMIWYYERRLPIFSRAYTSATVRYASCTVKPDKEHVLYCASILNETSASHNRISMDGNGYNWHLSSMVAGICQAKQLCRRSSWSLPGCQQPCRRQLEIEAYPYEAVACGFCCIYTDSPRHAAAKST